MIKIVSRILIIGLIIGGIWYISHDSNEEVQVLENDKIMEEENLTFKIKKGKTTKQVLETVKKAKVNEMKKSAKKIETVNTNNKKVQVIDSDKVTQNVSKFVEGELATEVTVYLYEYKINLSVSEIPAGNVSFRVVNTGRLSHNLTLKDGGGQIMFGRVAPGKTEYFQTNLSKSNLEVISMGRVDSENNMQASLTVK